MATINILQPNKSLQLMGGGKFDELKNEINDLHNQDNEIQKSLNNKLTIDKVAYNSDITETGYALDARHANPAINGSIAGKVENILSYPRIRRLVDIDVTSSDFIASNSWENVEVSISEYEFLNMPHAFIRSTCWLSVHSIELFGVERMRVTLMNPYNNPQRDRVSIVLIELM